MFPLIKKRNRRNQLQEENKSIMDTLHIGNLNLEFCREFETGEEIWNSLITGH